MYSFKCVKKQVNSLLYSFEDVMKNTPAFLMLIHSYVYFIYLWGVWEYMSNGTSIDTQQYPDWFITFHTYLSHFFDCSGIFLVLLTVLSRHFNGFNKICLAYLWVLFICSTIVLTFDISANIYLYSIMSMIYLTFVVITLLILTGRLK